MSPASRARENCQVSKPRKLAIMWNVIASQAPGGRGSDDGADEPAGPEVVTRNPLWARGATYLNTARTGTFMFGRDSFVNMLPVRI